MEEWIFSSDDEDEADDVRVCALDGLQATYSDFRNVSPAGMDGGSLLVEKNDGGCVGESGLVFDPGEDPAWTSGTRARSDHLGLDDEDGTVLAVGDAYGEERACGMVQCKTSIGGSSGKSLEEESVDPPWASTVGEMIFERQELTCFGTSGIEGNVYPKSGVRNGGLGSISTLGRLGYVGEVEIGSHSFVKPNAGTHHVFFDPGKEACVIAMNHTGSESSSVCAECWPRRLEECCRDLHSGTAILRDGLHLQNSRRCADTGKPILRLRGGGPVPRKSGRRKCCGGRKI